jgi:hypothetical protein
MDNAFKYIIANNGIDREAEYLPNCLLSNEFFLDLVNYPYQGVVGSCRFQSAWTGATMGCMFPSFSFSLSRISRRSVLIISQSPRILAF